MNELEDYNRNENDHSQTLETTIQIEWNNDAVISAVIASVSDTIYRDVKPTIDAALRAGLQDRVNEAFDDVLNRDIQETDRYGKPKGTTQTIRALLQRDAETWLTEPVGTYGRTGHNAHGNKQPRINYLFHAALRKEGTGGGNNPLHQMIVKALKDNIGDISEAVNQHVREAVRAKLTT